MASHRGIQVFTAFCESHTSQVPFHVVTKLFRAATGVEGLDTGSARALVRTQNRDAEPEDLRTRALWRVPAETRPATATTGIAIAQWRLR